MLLTRIWSSLAQLGMSSQKALTTESTSSHFPTFAFSEEWSVLGPFQIGTREAVWGSDPLEFLGGFRSLEYSTNATFRSSLAPNGTIAWSNHTAKLADPSAQRAEVELDLGFPNIDWQALRDTYGWSALQWQAWARGEILVQSDGVEILALLTPGILEFYIDDVHYFGGDFYSNQRAPLTLRLSPGIHRIDVRLVRDVRAMGGVGDPRVLMNLILQKSFGSLQPILNPHNGVLISDVVEDSSGFKLASPYASVVVRNDAGAAIEVLSVVPPHDKCLAELLSKVRLLPGQSRPVALRIECVSQIGGDWSLDFQYRIDSDDTTHTLSFAAYPALRGIREPHKVTFLHPGGIVSYAILRPPSKKVEDELAKNTSLPIFLELHGAGLEADDRLVRRSLDPLPNLAAWAMFPTGGTPWSGDDWHAWGFADVEAAIAMIPDWIERHSWKGSSANIERWVVSGHSNGGQGTWYTLLHRPDKVVAAAPISGYSSIQNYVPYHFWNPTDPGRTAIIQAALSTYRHEMLLPNAQHIPVYQQHGSADDNVPPYHSRQMSQLIREAGADSQYYEIEGKPHWWDGVITTYPLCQFYEEQVALATMKLNAAPSDPPDFSLVAVNPGDTGPKYGFEIIQLAVPGQYGRIDLEFDPITKNCVLRTSNVQMGRLSLWVRDCSQIWVDDQKLRVPSSIEITIRKDHSQWHLTELESPETAIFPHLPSRHGRQLAAMDAILRTLGAFQIVRHSPETNHVALQISRNLCQYFFADTSIPSDYGDALMSPGNIISLATGDSLPPSWYPNHPIYIEKGEIFLRRDKDGFTSRYAPRGKGLGAIFLRPLPLGRLELVIWGADEESLALAARLMPMMTGSGQPDFVVMDRSMLAKGIEGVLAMGFYDHDWRISGNAFFS